MVDLMADSAGLLDGLPHGKDQARDRHIGPLLQMEALGRVWPDPIPAAGLAEIGMTFAGVNEDDGDFGLVAVALADHLGGGAELAGGAVDGGG
jgi:hypothetical protein